MAKVPFQGVDLFFSFPDGVGVIKVVNFDKAFLNES